MELVSGHLYFIKDSFYNKYKNCNLMINKNTLHNKHHGRPCCYLFKENNKQAVYWMVPLSSQTSKYLKEYNHAINKYGVCDNISFGYVRGNKSAFLIQNMFPVRKEDVLCEYTDSNTKSPVTINSKVCSEVNAKARKRIRLNNRGVKIGISDISSIYNDLIK